MIKEEFYDDFSQDFRYNDRIAINKENNIIEFCELKYFPVFVIKNEKFNKNGDNKII